MESTDNYLCDSHLASNYGSVYASLSFLAHLLKSLKVQMCVYALTNGGMHSPMRYIVYSSIPVTILFDFTDFTSVLR